MHIALCDDDKNFVSDLEAQLLTIAENCCIDLTVASFTAIESFLVEAARQAGEPGFVCFLDIDMPEMTGFELAAKLRCLNGDTRIVFVSNKDELVFQSLEYHPFFFLRKNRLQAELEKQLMELYNSVHPKHTYETFQASRQTIRIDMETVTYAESEKNYLVLYFDKPLRAVRVRMKISEAEEQWEAYGFTRIHKGILINPRYIKQLLDDGLQLTTGAVLPVARSSMPELKRILFGVQKNG